MNQERIQKLKEAPTVIFVSRERFVLLAQLLMRCVDKRLDSDGDLPALYTTFRGNKSARVYFVYPNAIENYMRRVVYHQKQEEEST
jgi:hypothetical protein